MSNTDRIRQAQRAYDQAAARSKELGRIHDRADDALTAGKTSQVKVWKAWQDFLASVEVMNAAKSALDQAKAGR
ncbi:hypothetical protein GCM10010413_51950 [Promicromonospora sukumoe]|uniref:Uncharacterized protein n=1 Tax=Promicromonospora sukumoe TaxID=88382 RepID=A0A7W3PGC1_9MICO|nr:hypothetical protein [Promicromonospora sukumoe]MBA8810641.1 hypothetical protein [Promicromonospora sukumoe]